MVICRRGVPPVDGSAEVERLAETGVCVRWKTPDRTVKTVTGPPGRLHPAERWGGSATRPLKRGMVGGVARR